MVWEGGWEKEEMIDRKDGSGEGRKVDARNIKYTAY